MHAQDAIAALILFGSPRDPILLQLKHKLQANLLERSDNCAGEAEDPEKLLVHESLVTVEHKPDPVLGFLGLVATNRLYSQALTHFCTVLS